MIDREKVIKGLECCSEKQNCKECPFFCFNAKCQDDMNRDALSLLNEYDTQVQYRDDHIAEYEKEIKRLNKLLKEQEAKQVMESTNMYTGLPITHCPKCGISLDRYLYGRQYEGQINYCPMCGQAVKWDA